MPHDREGRDWSCAVASHGMPKISCKGFPQRQDSATGVRGSINLSAPWFWILSPQNYHIIPFSYSKLPILWYFVKATLENWLNCLQNNTNSLKLLNIIPIYGLGNSFKNLYNIYIQHLANSTKGHSSRFVNELFCDDLTLYSDGLPSDGGGKQWPHSMLSDSGMSIWCLFGFACPHANVSLKMKVLQKAFQGQF